MSSFSDLPAEIRNSIYEYAVVDDQPIALPYAFQKRPFREPALLSASRSIRAEASPVFYGANVFEAPSPAAAKQFLHRLTATQLAMIRHFRPIELVLPLSAHRRWFDALRANINRLVADAGKGHLDPCCISVPLQCEDGEVVWCQLQDIADFIVVPHHHGRWTLEWREDSEQD